MARKIQGIRLAGPLLLLACRGLLGFIALSVGCQSGSSLSSALGLSLIHTVLFGTKIRIAKLYC